MPTETPTGSELQRYLLSTVRQSQSAALGTIHTWTTIADQLTRSLRLPVAQVDLGDIVDRTFDLAEQTLAAQHELARTLVGAATRQVDTVRETADIAVAAVGTTVGEAARQVEDLPPAAETTASPKQDGRPDGRTYEERSVEELRERAGELQIEGRSTMTKDELIAALRNQRRSRSAKQERQPDRRTYEERSIEELRERARELQIEGRSSMSKDELIAALRSQAK